MSDKYTQAASTTALALAMAVQACGAETKSEDAGMSSPGIERDGQVGGDAQAGGDAGDSDSGSWTGSPRDGGSPPASTPACFDATSVPSCNALTNSSPSVRPKYGELLNASSLRAGARFVAIGGLAVLARHAEGSPRWTVAALSIDGDYQTRVRELRPTWEGSSDRFDILDVWGQPTSDPVLGADVFALACRTGSCAILAARQQEQETLTPLVQVELNAEVEAKRGGLAVSAGRVCVFGNGLYCYDGMEWRELLSSARAPGLRDVSFGGPDVAVGEADLVLVDEGNGWREVDVRLSTDGTFEYVDTQSGHMSLLRGDGVLSRGTPQAMTSCRQSARLVLADDDLGRASGIQHAVMDETGSVFLYSWNVHSQMRQWCFRTKVELEASVVGYASGTCGLSRNLLLLTEQRLFHLFGDRLMCTIAG